MWKQLQGIILEYNQVVRVIHSLFGTRDYRVWGIELDLDANQTILSLWR